MEGSIPTEESVPIFRAPKRRKIVRRKDDDRALRSSVGPPDSVIVHDGLDGQKDHTIDRDTLKSPHATGENDTKEVLRKLRAAKLRRGGIGFSNTAVQITAAGSNNDSMALVVSGDAQDEEAPDALDAIARRFAPQAGQISNVADDKIMNNYIDAEFARLQAGNGIAARGKMEHDDPRFALEATSLEMRGRNPATHGMLQEIDLGPSASTRNATMTEAATRRLDGDEAPVSEPKPEKVRLGRDGKPRRRRKRRNSEDLKRDDIVEAILKENKFDMYDEPEVPAQGTGDRAADEELADEFRREFLEALEARNKPKRPPAPPPVGLIKSKSDNPLKGPKLGGSRSARAAMHAREKEKATKK